MTAQIVSEPFVTLVASSKLNEDGVKSFAENEGLADALVDNDTPLGQILLNNGFTDEEKLPEFGGRFCYESWRRGRPTDEYVHNILDEAHGSVLRHTHLSFVITGVSRSLTHELIRHAAGVGISQQSQRYVNIENPRFIMPPLLLHYLEGDLECGEAQMWLAARHAELDDYRTWQEFLCQKLDEGAAKMRTRYARKRANEAARASLPNSIETKLLWTANLQALRWVIEARGNLHADLEIRRFAAKLAGICKTVAPTVFQDVNVVDSDFGVPAVEVTYSKV